MGKIEEQMLFACNHQSQRSGATTAAEQNQRGASRDAFEKKF